jgi:transcriptional regulator with XRE-family HTH domain
MGKIPPRQLKPIFLGEWIDAIPGCDRKGAADAAGIEISYISNLSSGKKANPSSIIMLALSEYLGITVNDLYRPPPSKTTLKELADLSPAARETLIRERRRSK